MRKVLTQCSVCLARGRLTDPCPGLAGLCQAAQWERVVVGVRRRREAGGRCETPRLAGMGGCVAEPGKSGSANSSPAHAAWVEGIVQTTRANRILFGGSENMSKIADLIAFDFARERRERSSA